MQTNMTNRLPWSESELAAMVQYIALYYDTSASKSVFTMNIGI